MKLIIIIFIFFIIGCTTAATTNISDSTIVYLKNNKSVNFEIAEVHPEGITDRLNRQVNFKSIDSIKICDLNTVLKLKDANKSIYVKHYDRCFLLDFSPKQLPDQSLNEYNNYLEKSTYKDRLYLSTGKVLGQITSGTLVGLLGAAPFLVGREPNLNNLFPAAIGYILGSAVGVYFISNEEEIRGSFFSTLKGSSIAAVFLIFPAPIGATIGYNSSRQFFTASSTSAGMIRHDLHDLVVSVSFIQIEF